MNLIENNKNELKDNLLTDELNTDLFNSIIKDYLEYNDFVKLSSVSKILNKKCIDLWNHMKSNKYKEKLTKNKIYIEENVYLLGE